MASAKLPEGFAEYPVSVTERRAQDGEDASKWTPRDAIVSMLRRIDRGEVKPDAVFVIVRETETDGSTRTFYSNAAKSLHVALGLLAHAQHRLLTDGKR